MPKSIDYRYISTLPAILRIVALLFNILAIIFALKAENPYYAEKRSIKFIGIAAAGAVFSAITLILVLLLVGLRDSLKWLRNELLIQCALIIVYVYGCVTMVSETLDCDHNIKAGCSRQLTATISGIAAIVVYIIDGVFKLREFRRKLRVQRLTETGDDAKVEEPYVDDEQSAAATVTTEEPQSPTSDLA